MATYFPFVLIALFGIASIFADRLPAKWRAGGLLALGGVFLALALTEHRWAYLLFALFGLGIGWRMWLRRRGA